MKTKLIRKIRKQYSIVYYPNGYDGMDNKIYHKGKYILFSNWMDYLNTNVIYRAKVFKNKQDAIDEILKRVRIKYKEYSRKYVKINYNGIKVWHNA